MSFCSNSKEMYKKVECTSKLDVLRNKPVAFDVPVAVAAIINAKTPYYVDQNFCLKLMFYHIPIWLPNIILL